MPPIDKSTDAEVLAEAIARATVKATREWQAEERPIEIRNPPKKSVYNPSGGVRPAMRCPVVFCGAPQDPAVLTNEEIELLNQVVAGRYNKGKWQVIVRDDGMGVEQEHKEIRLPVSTLEQRMELPHSMVAILKQILAEAAERKNTAAAAA